MRSNNWEVQILEYGEILMSRGGFVPARGCSRVQLLGATAAAAIAWARQFGTGEIAPPTTEQK
jgi:hypothetical protein